MATGRLRAAVLCLAAVSSLAVPWTASQAVSITLVTDGAPALQGGNFNVQLLASSLDVGTEIVAGYDLDILFDPTQFTFVTAAFGTFLGSPLDSESGFSLLEPGRLDLFEVSLLFDEDLFARQTVESFTLASLTFQALVVGTSGLEIDTTDLFLFGAADEEGFPTELTLEELRGATVQTTAPVEVPEPSSSVLMALGLIGLAAARRRRVPVTSKLK